VTVVTKETINLKELLLSGYKKTSIMKLVTGAEAFSDIQRRHGYAIPYTYAESILICIGCELFDLGLSFRHVDIVLSQLKNVKPGKRDLKDLLVVFGRPENVAFEVAESIGGKMVRRDVIFKKIRESFVVRTTPLIAKTMTYQDFRETLEVNSTLGSIIVVDINEIREMVDRLFE